MEDLPPQLSEMEAHAECEGRARPGDGARTWLGVVIVVVSAAVVAAGIVWVLWG